MKSINDEPENTALGTALVARLYRFDCPTPLELADWETGLLDPNQAQRVEQHMPHCLRCQQEVAEMRTFITEAEIAVQLSDILSRGRRVLEALLAPANSLALATVRGEVEHTQFYHTENIEVSLQTEDDPTAYGKKLLSGSVVVAGAVPPPGTIVLFDGRAAKTIDPAGTFEITGIQPGSYTMIIQLQDIDVQIKNIAI